MLIASCAVALLIANVGDAGEVRTGVSSRETYVGIPVTFQVQFSDVSEHEPPQLPEVDGLEIEAAGAPSRSTRITIINGRRSQQESVTYSFEVTPQREGEFLVPAFTVAYDDRQQLVSGFRLIAQKSETGDLLEVSIDGRATSVYVGEALDLQLNILVKPYESEEPPITLSEGQMWQLLSARTDWGIFSDRMEELTQQNQRPVGREVTRRDDEGRPQTYYLYTVDTTIYPQRPGTIDAEDCRVVMNYPTELGRRRSPLAQMFDDDGFPSSRFFDDRFAPFASRLTVTSARPIIAEASMEPLTVKPIPEEGRPADYRGAVGRYRMIAQVKPHKAKVGDPISLHLAIAGDGPMDLVQAPPLAELADLTKDFRVSRQPLAGLVEGDTKLFTTTIRPRSPRVAEVPAIPFSYFDPEQEKFVTVHSEPIPITVEAAETLSMERIISNDSAPPGGELDGVSSSDETAPAASPVDAVVPISPHVSQHGPAALIRPHDIWWIAVPPLAVLLLFVVSSRTRFAGLIHGLSPADQQLRRRVQRARSPLEVRDAVLAWIARKTKTSAASASLALGQLRMAGKRRFAVDCEEVLDRCRRAETGVVKDPALQLEQLKEDAMDLIGRWDQRDPRSHHHGPGQQNRSARRAVTSGLLIAVAAASWPPSANAQEIGDEPMQLAAEQREVLLDEAMILHRQAVASHEESPAQAREQAEQAASKYQLLIDAGMRNAAIHFNAAGAEFHAKRTGRAIAHYRSALMLDPDDRRARAALRHVQQSAGIEDPQPADAESLPPAVITAALELTRWLPAATLRHAALAAWVVLWVVVAMRLVHWPLPWKSLATVAAVVVVVTGSAYLVHHQHWTQDDVAIVVQPELTVRAGDGETYPTVAERQQAEGTTVRLITQRNGWAKISLDPTTTGWVPADAIVPIGHGLS